ncbi:hypothetical protein niasHS_011509 [Heterodera schachtii]|uniref:DNA-directed DNA polymerase n=1 Tax=Heterodera schachtii TaxID=97005 RepID=A0ABD2IFK1_HETSC
MVDDFPTNLKHLRDVIQFGSSGLFYARVRVADLQFSLYKACPLMRKGMLCKKKVDEELYCASCDHRANKPTRNLYLRLELQDCEDPEISQTATVFSAVAEHYLNLKVEQFAKMVEEQPGQLEALLKSKIEQTVAVKLSIKAKGELEPLDWIVVSIQQENREIEGDEEASPDGQMNVDTNNEDGEIIEIESSIVNSEAYMTVEPTMKRGQSTAASIFSSSSAAVHNDNTAAASASDSNAKRQRRHSWDFKTMAHFEEERVKGEEDRHRKEKKFQQPAPLFEQKQHYVHRVERFALQRHVTEFMLSGKHDEPEEALLRAFEHIIARAIRNAEDSHQQTDDGRSTSAGDGARRQRRVTRLGILLNGRGLTDPILLPIRPPEQNTAEVLMAELDKLGQSDGDEDVHGGGISKRSLLLSEPIEVVVTCIAPPVGAAPRFYQYQHWGYDDRQLIRVTNLDDNFCLFHALVATRAYTDQQFLKATSRRQAPTGEDDGLQWDTVSAEIAQRVIARKDFCAGYEALNRLVSNRERMNAAVTELMQSAGIPADQEAYGMEHINQIQQFWDQNYVGIYRIVLFEDHSEELPRPIWKGPMGRRLCVSLFLSDGHYYVGPQYPCVRQQGVCLHCTRCNRFFFSRSCFDGHRGSQTCNLLKRCTICNRTFQQDPKRPHKCYSTFCTRCKVYHEKDAGCFIKKVAVPNEKQQYRIVCYDTETRLDPLEEAGQQRHKVNQLSVRVTCTECCDSERGVRTNCQICISEYGTMERIKDWSEAEGHEPISEFVEWILRAWTNKYKTFIWAHNASRFDGHFVLKYLGETKRRPDVVMNGLKIFEFRLQHSRRHSLLTWRDSCLLMPIRLEDMPKTFSLDCDDKPFFPYSFNRRENYGVRLQHLPQKDDYCPGSMKLDKYEKFEKWYDMNRNTPFFLPHELRLYCQNDTEILLSAIVQFRRIMMDEVTNGFDVLPLSATIASVCMTIFKGQFLKEKQLAIVPECGYERNDRASVFAIKYLDWRSKKDGIRIQHAGNGLEKRWRQFRLDGWIEEHNKCIEVLGCYWHGCEHCFKPDDKLADGKTCRELNELTHLRILKLREPGPPGDVFAAGLDVEEIWECKIREQLTRDPEMCEFFADLGTDRGPIDPRHAYYGGRTGPLQLIAEPKEDEKISVFDIISLYPWVNYSTDYPVGIPSIIYPTGAEMIVNWTRPEQLQFRGIYRVRVIPPRGLRIPVLPLKIDDRLLFCCCHRCASTFRKANTRLIHKCKHTDEQRAFVGNYTHIELARALESGYIVDRFWRAWNYEEWSDQIFKDYVRLLIKLKIEASGFPDGVVSVEQQQHYAEEYRRTYSVNLELEREVSAIIPLSDSAVRVLYKHKKNFVTEHSSSNIVLSLWTTSRARLKLLDFMTQIERTEGAKLLYTDTDSVVVLHKRDVVPIQTGEYLGQMSEEYLGYDIKSFVCGGAKQYGFRMKDKRTGTVEYIIKIRGITFDVNNSKALQFESFQQKVANYGRIVNIGPTHRCNDADDNDNDANVPSVFHYNKIMPTRDSRVITRENHRRMSDKNGNAGKSDDDNGSKKNVGKESKSRKRSHPLPLLSCRARQTWAEALDNIEKKYSKMEEDIGGEESDNDAIDFFADSVDEIMEKIHRSEEKVKKWMTTHGRGKAKVTSAELLPVAAPTAEKNDLDSNNSEKDEDEPTSTVYLDRKKS